MILKTLLPLIVFICIYTKGHTQESSLAFTNTIGHELTKQPHASFVQIVRFKSTLPDSIVFSVIEKRKVEFLKVPGLVQKYYLRDPKTMEFCGIYLWASEQDFLEFKKSDLAKSSAQAYQIDGQARVELYNMIYPLK
jgi:hypothetical protein